MRKMKRASIAMIVLAAVAGSTPVGVGANGPEPPGSFREERIQGPATVGTITVQANTDGGINFLFVGRCGGRDVTFGTSFVFPFVKDGVPFSADRLIDQRFTNGTLHPQVADCYRHLSGGDLIINTVTRFSQVGNVATADVVILAVVPF
jgi:hypothetical protein